MSSANPLVAIAERAHEHGTKHAVLVLLDAEGNVVLHNTDETPPVVLAGMLTFALSMVTDTDDAED